MRNSKLTLFFISQSLANAYFWIALAIPYLIYRGLSPVQAFSLMAIYQVMGVILEYPTGVIGDKFGYRKVIYLSNILNFLAMIIMSFNGGYHLYLAALFVLAVGNGFLSGNDMGLIKAVSKNIRKDTANYNALIDFTLFVSSIIGGFLAKISYEFALIVSGIIMFSASIPLFLIRGGTNQHKNTDSVAKVVKDGLSSLHNPTFRQLFIFVALFGGYSFTIKSTLGSFSDLYHIEIASIGIIIGLSGLARSIGGKLYAELQNQNIFIPAVLLCLSMVLMGLFPSYYLIVGLMILGQFLCGYILSKIDGDLHDLAPDNIRASLFSLKRLVMRLVASSYLMLYGYMIEAGRFSLMIYATGIMLMIGIALTWQYLNVQKHLLKETKMIE